MSILVYLGPSLDRDIAAQKLSAQYAPPIKRGDLDNVESHIEKIAIVDGEFGQSLSVTPKEILKAMCNGVEVWGASSMGALRAAELYPYGMKGYGWVFDAYRNGSIDADDEVALTFDPFSGRACTVPLVNVRYWLDDAVSAGLIESRVQRSLLRACRRIFFADRTTVSLYKLLEEELGGMLFDTLLRHSGGQISDVKRTDAEGLLSVLARGDTACPTLGGKHG